MADKKLNGTSSCAGSECAKKTNIPKMGQKMVKRELEKAEVLYSQQRFDEAAQSWIKVMKHLSKPKDKFQVCGKVMKHLSKLEDKFKICGKVMKHLSKPEDKFQVCGKVMKHLINQKTNSRYVVKL